MTKLPGPRTPIGHALWGVRMLRSPYDTLLRLYERWGPVVQIGVWPSRFVYVFGPEANELILSTRVRDFTWREAFSSLIPVDGDTALVVSDGEDHARRRRLVQPAFAVRRIQGYAPVVVEEAERMMDGWRVGQALDFHAEAKTAIRRVAIRSLFGDHLGEQAAEVGKHLQVAIDFANIPPLPGRDLDVPGSPYRRAMRARAKVDVIVYEEIERRRAKSNDERDLLGALIAARDEDGSTLTDEELRDQVVSLIAGGYETTAAMIAWMLYAVLRDAEVEKRLRAELDEVFADQPVAEEGLARCTYLSAVVMETLRLHGAAGVSGRKAQADIEFAGHTIPAGRMVIYSQYVTHRLPDDWPDPLRFDPDRWLDGESLREAAPYTFVPFGGGYRRCIGFAMATLEAKLMIASALRRSQLQLHRTDIPGTGIATYAPKGGVPITVIDV